MTATGEIQSGYQPNDVIGSSDVRELLQKAIDDESVKAVVLRLDTPGGSATASPEHIRRDLGSREKSWQTRCHFHGQCNGFRWLLDRSRR